MPSARPSPIKSTRHPSARDGTTSLHATIHTLANARQAVHNLINKLSADDPCSLGGGDHRLGVCNVYAYKNKAQYKQPAMSCTQITTWYEM